MILRRVPGVIGCRLPKQPRVSQFFILASNSIQHFQPNPPYDSAFVLSFHPHPPSSSARSRRSCRPYTNTLISLTKKGLKTPTVLKRELRRKRMDKLDKLKLASSSFGERLKTGGAQMSRIVSSKMKEILQAPTPESKMVDEATLETMEEPNWGLNLRICAMINSEEFNGTEIVKAVKKKLLGKSPVSQRLSLDLLETCTSNCEKVFSEVASEKVLDDMMKVIDDPKTDHENRVKAMQLIRAWGESEDLVYLPVFQQTYTNLKTRAIPSGMPDDMQHHLGTYINQEPLSPPGSYPVPDMGLQSAENDMLTGHGGQSVEEKREFLVVTRNTLDLFSCILNFEDGSKPIKNELTESMLENCKHSLPGVRGIIEGTTDNEGLLIEALSLHDELQQVISRYEQMDAAVEFGGSMPKHGASEIRQPDVPDAKETSSLEHGENGIDAERREFPNVETTEARSEFPRTVTSEKDGVAGAKERVDLG